MRRRLDLRRELPGVLVRNCQVGFQETWGLASNVPPTSSEFGGLVQSRVVTLGVRRSCQSCSFRAMLCFRLGMISGRSVNVTGHCQVMAAAKPTNPVPEPSSRTLRSFVDFLLGRCPLNEDRFLARTYDEPQVFRPRLSPVKPGSWSWIETVSSLVALGTGHARVMAGIAVKCQFLILYYEVCLESKEVLLTPWSFGISRYGPSRAFGMVVGVSVYNL